MIKKWSDEEIKKGLSVARKLKETVQKNKELNVMKVPELIKKN